MEAGGYDASRFELAIDPETDIEPVRPRIDMRVGSARSGGQKAKLAFTVMASVGFEKHKFARLYPHFLNDLSVSIR